MEALTGSVGNFSNNDDFDWIPEVSDSDSEPDIDRIDIGDMLFEDSIYTEDEAKEDTTAIPKSIGLNFYTVKRNLYLLENVVSRKIFHQTFPVWIHISYLWTMI